MKTEWKAHTNISREIENMKLFLLYVCIIMLVVMLGTDYLFFCGVYKIASLIFSFSFSWLGSLILCVIANVIFFIIFKIRSKKHGNKI